jgi:LPXTG-site transpeptidase (sortase) family protein
MRKKDHLPKLLLLAGISLITLSSTHRLLQRRSLSLSAELVAKHQNLANNKGELVPTHLKIGWYIDRDITPQAIVSGQWATANDTVSYLLSSARPTESGNIILYGHNYAHILSNLRLVPLGTQVELTLGSGVKRQYVVTQTAQVPPSNTSYLQPKNSETLTIYTCAGILDSERFIVQADPVVSP